MRILVAEDELTSRTILDVSLRKWGYDPILVDDGIKAWDILSSNDAPRLALLDWLMPEMDGLEVCRKIREIQSKLPPYIIMLTSKDQNEDIMSGFDAGADDFLKKPFFSGELRARINVGKRITELQNKLSEQIQSLNKAMEHIKVLQGIIPICSFCKRIRDDKGYWDQVENYMSQHSEAAKFSHSVCPECFRKNYPDFADRVLDKFNKS